MAKGLLLFLLCGVPVFADLRPTGQSSDGIHDANYRITVDGTQESAPGAATIVVNLPGGWAQPSSGSMWIGPAADQTNSNRSGTCCKGVTTYHVEFTIIGAPTGSLHMQMLADDFVGVYLNREEVFRSNGGGMYGTAQEYDLDFNDSPFKEGSNTMDFIVDNSSGGPTGLDVSFNGSTGSIGAATTDPVIADDRPPIDMPKVSPYGSVALTDPVDAATGQFYESGVDLNLGGPLNLVFARYYSSSLSVNRFITSLGVNWMSNWDVTARISGTTAQVLLFEAKALKFSKVNGLWQILSPNDVIYQFVQSGTGYKLMSPVSRNIYTFSATGALTRVEDRNGNALTVTPGPNGPTQVSDGLGRTLNFIYAGKQLTGLQDHSGRSITFAYTGNLLSSAKDTLGNTTNYSYTSAGAITGLMTRKQLPLGNALTTQTYDSSGRVITQSDANGKTSRLSYDSKGTTVVNVFGNSTNHTSDANGDVTQLTYPTGASAKVAYDNAYRRISITDKLGNVTKYTYHAQTGYLATTTDALGNTTTNSYTTAVQAPFTFYDKTGIAFSDGTSASFTYDPKGNVLSATAADGTTSKYGYDGKGRLISQTDANGQTSTLAYNPDSTVTSTQDPLANTTTYAYDTLKRLTKITDPSGGMKGLIYDAADRVVATSDPTGAVETTQYDANGQRSSWISPSGGVFGLTYTQNGRIASFADPLGNTTSYSYDAANRLTATKNAIGETVALTYDLAHRVATVSDNAGPRVSYTYDAENRIASVTDATGRKSVYGYDALGRFTTNTTPSGNKYALSYDKRGRLVGITDPLGGLHGRTFDALGRLTQVTEPGSLTTLIRRNVLGQTVAVTTPNGNTWSLDYDTLQRPSKMTDPLGNSTSFNYTANKLSGVTLPLGTISIASDADNRIIKREFSDGTTIGASYDAMGLLASADGVTVSRDSKGMPTNINGIGITLDPAGRPATLTYAPGNVVRYAYDNAGRLSSVSDWVGGTTAFTYDAASRLATLTYPNGVMSTYTTDADGRVIKIAAGGLGAITLTRDAAGKITSADRNLPVAPALQASSQQSTYDAAGQLNSAAYDTMGRVTAQNGRTYTWNLASELVSFQDGVNSANITYDGLGEISSSTSTGVPQTFVFNYLFNYPALSIVRQAGIDLRYYIYLPNGKLLYSVEAADNSRKFYHFDEMGNTAFLTGEDGTLTDSYGITPYGENADHFGATDNPFTWQGQYGVIQEGQGLYYVRSRHYDAYTARFLSRDPVMSVAPRAAEPYAYANGNPLLFIDPSGNWGQWLADISSSPLQLTDIPDLGVLNKKLNDLWEADGGADQGLSAEYSDLARYVVAETADPSMNWAQLQAKVNPPAPPPPPDPPAPPTPAAPPPQPSQPCAAQTTAATLLVPNGPGILYGQTGVVNSGQRGTQTALIQQLKIVGGRLITQDGAGVVLRDGFLITQDGGGILAKPGDTVLVDGRAYLIGHDGGSLITQDGGGFKISEGSGAISHDGSGAISHDGSGVISDHGIGLISNNSAK